MKPPICDYCDKRFGSQVNDGGLVRFADYVPLPDGMTGHPDGLGWFCGEHIRLAESLTHLSLREACREIGRIEQVQTPASFKHFILTRFNLRMWEGITPTDEWLAHRLDLFEQFCLPSVRGQKNQNFCWLLLFDVHTSAEFRERIGRYADVENIEALYLNGFDLQVIIGAVQERISAETTHVITTTLDNDDALAEEYVDLIQSRFSGQQFELLNPVHGLRYDVVGGKLYRCKVKSNPFISLIEQKNGDGSLMTIAACLPHSTIGARFPNVTDLQSPPLWMQVVHERNLEMTNLAGRQRIPLATLTKRFHLKHPHEHIRENPGVIRLQNMRARAERIMIDALPDEFKLRLRAQLSKFLRK